MIKNEVKFICKSIDHYTNPNNGFLTISDIEDESLGAYDKNEIIKDFIKSLWNLEDALEAFVWNEDMVDTVRYQLNICKGQAEVYFTRQAYYDVDEDIFQPIQRIIGKYY